VDAVVFDMDGVLIDSEHVWDEIRERLAGEWGGRYSPGAQRAMMGMSSVEWSRYMHDELGIARTPSQINDEVVRRMLARYREELPVVPGALAAVTRLHEAGLLLAVASSSNRPLIDTVLGTAGVASLFAVTVSSEEVARGKPAPDVYLAAAHRLGLPAASCAAIEDSASGIRSAAAAGMRVIAYPNVRYPPPPDALGLADTVIESLDDLTPELVRGRR
jgi:HAD superfamily hydrolase (TIGR01509 family)